MPPGDRERNVRSRSIGVLGGLLVLACRAGTPTDAAAPSAAPSIQGASTPDADESNLGFELAVEVVDASGRPVPSLTVGVRGSYDTHALHHTETDAQGRARLSLPQSGVWFVTAGDSALDIVSYRSSATRQTVVLELNGPGALHLVHDEGATRPTDEQALRPWPAAESNARVARFIGELMVSAKAGDTALSQRVDAQWQEILDEPDPRLRSLMIIHYATYASQAVGPERFGDLLLLVPADDRAWAVQSGYLLELVWVQGNEDARNRLIAALDEAQTDPGVHAVLIGWALSSAAERGDQATVHATFATLAQPPFDRTIAFRNARRHDPNRPLHVGAPLPPFSLVRMAGGEFGRDDMKGRAWLVHVWATWCQPCREELDELPALHREFATSGAIEFLAISVDDERSLAEQTLRAHTVTWPSLWAEDAEAFREAWGFSGVPLTVLVGPDGAVRQVWDRKASVGSLRTAIESMNSASVGSR